jgi:hypothetical protein
MDGEEKSAEIGGATGQWAKLIPMTVTLLGKATGIASRMRMTQSFKSAAVGFSVPSQCNDYSYPSMVRSETFVRYLGS